MKRKIRAAAAIGIFVSAAAGAWAFVQHQDEFQYRTETSTLENQRSVVDLLTHRMVASVSLVQAPGGGWDVSQLPTSRDLRSSK